MSEKKIRVRAEDGYQKKNLKDNELNEIPIKGQEWEVTKARFEELKVAGKKYGVTFVREVKHAEEKEPEEEKEIEEANEEELKKAEEDKIEKAVKTEPKKRNAKK